MNQGREHGLLARFRSIGDPRQASKARHTLEAILAVMTFGTTVIGGDTIAVIIECAQDARLDLLARSAAGVTRSRAFATRPASARCAGYWPVSTGTKWTGKPPPTLVNRLPRPTRNALMAAPEPAPGTAMRSLFPKSARPAAPLQRARRRPTA